MHFPSVLRPEVPGLPSKSKQSIEALEWAGMSVFLNCGHVQFCRAEFTNVVKYIEEIYWQTWAAGKKQVVEPLLLDCV